MVQKKKFPNMLIETKATEESNFPISTDHQIRLEIEKRKTMPI
jgi:hypothetical protein